MTPYFRKKHMDVFIEKARFLKVQVDERREAGAPYGHQAAELSAVLAAMVCLTHDKCREMVTESARLAASHALVTEHGLAAPSGTPVSTLP